MMAGDGKQGVAVYEPDARLQTRWVTPDVLAYIVEKIVRAVGPKQVIVFGSQARGTAGEASDLDLFVVNDGPLSNDTEAVVKKCPLAATERHILHGDVINFGVFWRRRVGLRIAYCKGVNAPISRPCRYVTTPGHSGGVG